MAQLNQEQKQAITTNSNVVLVIAGAGSGKTTVLIEKIRTLIEEEHLYPSRILALTFTNNAAHQIKERLTASGVNDANRVKAYTFHGFCIYLLNRFSNYLRKYSAPIAIIDPSNQQSIVGPILKDLKIDETSRKVVSHINYAKEQSLTHEEVINYIDPQFIKVYEQYQQYLYHHNQMDFNDLLMYVYELLMVNEEARRQIQSLFDYILIDEYQDTSLIQDKIVSLIKQDTTPLFVVGDVDQSIYRWRGALIENILSIQDRYDDVSVIKLEQNYRSTKPILDAANLLIENNEYRYDKNLFTDSKGGKKITYKDFSDPLLESNFIANEVKFHQQLHPEHTIAILYRKNSQSALIEDALIKNNIQYKLLAGKKFFERMEVRDIISYLQLIVNHHDDNSLLRIINRPQRKIGPAKIERIIALSQQLNCSYFEACKEIKECQGFYQLIIEAKTKLEANFDTGFDWLIEQLNYSAFCLKNSDNQTQADERMENVFELKQTILYNLNDEDLTTSINNLLLFSVDDEIEAKVVLSTIHGVKGLEFDYVYVIGMNQGILPSGFNLDDQHSLEEERRLCYVAITRAKKELTLTSYECDQHGFYPPSQFLSELGLVDQDDFMI